MKIGDLVQLSAYGKKLKTFYIGRDDDVGIVISKHRHSLWFGVKWASDGKIERSMDRREIKYARKIA